MTDRRLPPRRAPEIQREHLIDNELPPKRIVHSINDALSPAAAECIRDIHMGHRVAQPHSSFDVGICWDQNKFFRREMEDSHAYFYDYAGMNDQGFFAIYDGHGGRVAANWCGRHLHEILAKNLLKVMEAERGASESAELAENIREREEYSISSILKRTFLESDEYLTGANGIFSGSTAVVCLLRTEIRSGRPTRILYTANVGDSRAVLYRKGVAFRLTVDHRATETAEIARIRDAGGAVHMSRVNGILAVTRSLGDEEMKPYVTAEPHVYECIIEASDEFIILACDGVWDVMGDQETCTLAKELLEASQHDLQDVARQLKMRAMKKGSMDNISIIIVRLRSHPPSQTVG